MASPKRLSQGHQRIKDLIKEHSLYWIQDEYPAALVVSGGKGWYDLALPQLKLFIEINGAHHERVVDWSGRNAEQAVGRLDAQRISDRKKMMWAKDNGWAYFAISDVEAKKISWAALSILINQALDERDIWREQCPLKRSKTQLEKPAWIKERQRAVRKEQYQQAKKWRQEHVSSSSTN